MTTTTVIVTGAKAGIGKGLLTQYASRPNTVAIAAIREGDNSGLASALTSLPVGQGSKIIVAEYDATSTTAAANLVTYLKNTHGIVSLDIVVANAGILNSFGPAKDVASEAITEHFKVNSLAPILLYQATQSLLNTSTQTPKFFIISSSVGSNSLMDSYPIPLVAYGMSKAAVNFAAGRIHREEKKIIVVPVHPGWVQTAMGNNLAGLVGMKAEDVPVKLEDSISGLMVLFDRATKAEHSGQFWDHKSERVLW